MDNKLQEFQSLWNNRFPDTRVPDLSFLINSPLILDMIAEVLKKDKETQPARKQTLQLKEVQYCLSYILELQLTSVEGQREEYEPDSNQSLHDRFDLPKRPSHLLLYSDKQKKGQYENWKGAARPPTASKYDTLPSPIPKVIHSEKFTDTMTKVCKVILPDQGRTLLESLGVTCNGPIDLSRTLLNNRMIDESDLSPFFKALEDNQLAHLISFFDTFKKKESSGVDENAMKNNEHYMEMKPIDRPTEQGPPPLPSSPRPEMPPKKLFPEGLAEGQKIFYFSDGPARGSSSLNRRGSLDITKLGENRATLPRRGRHQLTGSLESLKPKKLLSMVQPKFKALSSSSQTDILPANKLRNICIQRDYASDSEEGGSRIHSPARSPMSPISPRSGFHFVIRLIEACKPLDRADDGLAGLEGYERLLLFKGERLDVIDVWTDEYVARNMKGEIGLVPKDKCEVLTGVSPVLWGREWFLKCPKRHLGSELLQNEPVGTFFIRECHSKPGDLVISVKLITTSAKFQITVKTAKYEVLSHFFPTLETLIAYYKENAIYLDDGRQIFLTEPLRHDRCM